MAETEIKKINGRTLCDNQARTDINKVQQELDSMVFNETDPTVPEWAKASTKPTYTAEEVGALPSTTKIPSKTSDLTNDSGFLTYIPSIYVTEEELEAKHYLTSVPDHYVTKIDLDNRGYLTESDIEVELDQFITEDEVEATIEGEISAVKDELQGEIEQGLESHNTDTEAHNDIRLLIEGLTTRLNTLADSDDTTLDQMSELVAYIKDNRELIEGVTTSKVNVSDIIDNLTTNVSNKPLSAAQGVALKSLIDTLSNAKADKATTLAGYGITDGATKGDLEKHTSDKVSHITAQERTAWNSKAEGEHTHLWKDVADRPFGSIVETVELFANETFTNETVQVLGNYYVHDLTNILDVHFFDFIEYKLVVNGVEYTDYTVLDNTRIAFNDVTIGNTTGQLIINRSSYARIRFLRLDYGEYELNVSLYATVHKIEKMHLPDDIGKVKTVNYIAPDENGNVNVEGGSGSGKADSAFNLFRSDTLSWNGDTEGKIVAPNTKDPSMPYVRVSSVVPTLTELQNGGSYATTGADGIPYEQPFTSESIVDGDTYINCFDGYVLIAKVDGARFTDEYTDCTMPKAGIYFAYFGDEGYTSKLAINEYNGFVKPILKMENLTPHRHDWYGKETNKGNTARSDDVIHGGFVKVSDAVPTLAEVQKGGTIRSYSVVDNKISGDLIIANYLESPYSIASANGEILIASDGVPMVQIKNTGVYFRQDQNSCIHSLTINEYTGFSFNLEKVPTELLPTKYIKQLAAESLSADYIKQLIREVVAEMGGVDTDGLQDLNGDYLYDVSQNKLIAKE